MDAVDATIVAIQDMLDALYLDVFTEAVPKNRQLAVAKGIAGSGRFTDRAMVLDQEVAV